MLELAATGEGPCNGSGNTKPKPDAPLPGSLRRTVEQWLLASLISWRTRVRILSVLMHPTKGQAGATRFRLAVHDGDSP